MAFAILGSPVPSFFDSSGSPLVAGTITILNPSDDTVKASYPTADDANASTNGTSGAITLDARGEPTSTQLWGKDSEDYKIVIKDSSGSTILTMDDIRMPAANRRATVTFTSGDGTPSIAESSTFITAGTTAITDFDDGEVGDIIYIVGATGTSELLITHSSTILLQGNQSFTFGDNDTLTLAMFEDQVWQEISRSPEAYGSAITIVGSTTVTRADSGATYYLNAVGGFLTTLPSPDAGLEFTFIVQTAPTTAYTVRTLNGDNIMYGMLADINATTPTQAVVTHDTISFVASTSLIGDRVEMKSDGTNWYVFGFSSADGGITASNT